MAEKSALKKVKDFFTKSPESEQQEEDKRQENIGVQFTLPEDEKSRVIEMMIEMRKESEHSRTGFMAIREECIRQYEGIKESSDVPWPGHSNVSTMVTTVACDLLHSKLFPMVWNEKSITWQGIEEHDIEIAEVNRTVMSFVTSTDMKIQNTMDDLVHMLVVDGTVAVKKYWKTYWVWVTRKIPKEAEMYVDEGDGQIKTRIKEDVSYERIQRERCYIELRPLEKVYIPFNANTYEKDWEDHAEYIIDERWYTLSMLKELQQDGVIDPNIDLDKVVKGAMDETEEFKATEKARQEAEGSAPSVDARKEMYKIKCLEGEILYDVDKDGRREKCVFLIAENLKLYLSGKPMHAVSKVSRSSWLIRPFLRRPGRAYGKSIPELVRHLHNELDNIHNQRLDAGNMAIAPFFFYRAASGTKARRIIAGPATGIPLNDPERDVKFPTFPSHGLQVSFQEEKLVMELIERLTYLTPAMLGKETASRPTARGTLAVIAQGEQKFGLIGQRVQAIVCDLLTDIRQKYEEHMPPETWSRIMGREMKRKWPSPEAMIGMYEAKMQLDLTSMDQDTERQLAGMMYQTMGFDPIVMQNPVFMWEVRADYLRAMRRTPVERYIGPRPQTEMDANDAEEVFSMLEQEMVNIPLGDPSTLLPHLMKMRESDRYKRFTPEAMVAFNEYIRKLKMAYIDNVMKGMEANAARPQQGAPGAGQAPGLGMSAPQMPRAVGATGASNRGSSGPNGLPSQGGGVGAV